MFDYLLKMLDAVIQTEEPLKTILISFVMSILTCVSVIIIGAGIEKIQKLEIKLLMHFMSPKKALFIADRLTFPGTMLHEIAHALIAWTTGAVIQKIKLLTFFDAHRLGYVYFCPRGNKVQQYFQLSIVSCAPVLLGMIELNIIYGIYTSIIAPLWLQILLIYLFISILNHMTMSTADVKNYCRGLIVVLPVVFLVFYFIRLIAFKM